MNLPMLSTSGDGTARAARTAMGGAAEQRGAAPETPLARHDLGDATFVFGKHELDQARFELRRDDMRVPIQPKALRLLFYLVAHRERAVSSDELLAQLWCGETVTRGSLKRAVLAARRALDETGEKHSSIRTVRGHGYHFVRPVQVIVPQGAAPAAGPSTRAAP